MSDLKELIGIYWDIAYREGGLGVDHDTKTGAAQETWMEIERIIDSQQAEITKKTENYLNVCRMYDVAVKDAQALEVIIGNQRKELARLNCQQVEIERLTAACIQAKRFITRYHWKDNPPSSGNWDVSGACDVYEQLKEVLKHD